jgi:hypothetical protein
VNALATEILDTAVDGDAHDRRARLRARAAAQGLRQATQGRAVSSRRRAEALSTGRKIPPVIDAILDDDRDRR